MLLRIRATLPMGGDGSRLQSGEPLPAAATEPLPAASGDPQPAMSGSPSLLHPREPPAHCTQGSPHLPHWGPPSLLHQRASSCCPLGAPGLPHSGSPSLWHQRNPQPTTSESPCCAQGAPILPSESPHCTQGGLSLLTAGRQCWGGLCQLCPRDTGRDIALDRKSRKLSSQWLCRGSQGPNHDPGEVLILLPLPCPPPSSAGSHSSGVPWGKVGSAQARWQLTSSERSRPISCACSRSFAFRVSTCQHRQG